MDASSFRDAVFQVHTQGRERGHYFLTSQDKQFTDRNIHINGHRLLSFGSCSYLGLEFDKRLIDGASDAYQRYGAQTSFSRGYLSSPLYQELEEDLFPRIFGVAQTLLLPSTSIAHHVAMPALIDERDAVVIDHQVHRSVDDAVTLQCARSNAKKVVIKHGELEQAIDVITKLARHHRQVWFMCDGVYSMYGDYLPASFLHQVLAIAPNVRLYIDDAHGMSWTGKFGRGHFLSRFDLDERVVLVTSLAKAFATGGGVLVTKDPSILETARLVGGPYSFSGPLRPGDLGASIASAKLHLTDELLIRQNALQARITQANKLCRSLHIPLVIENEAPIFFIALGRAQAVFLMAEKLREDGFHVNVSGFPAVPASRGGLRVALSAIHTEQEVNDLFHRLAHHMPEVLSTVGITQEEILDQFEGVLPKFMKGQSAPTIRVAPSAAAPQSNLTVETFDSIEKIDQTLWDQLLSSQAYIDARSMRAAEKVFHKDRPLKHDKWSYQYTFVRDENREVVAATVFTQSIIKDDTFMSAEVSTALEKLREADPYLFTSNTIATGTMASEGLHLYLKPGPTRDAALVRLIEAGANLAKERGCRTLVLGDFPEPAELSGVFTEQGLVPLRLLDNHVVHLDWQGEDAFIESLPTKNKRNYARGYQEQSKHFSLEVWDASRHTTDNEIEQLHSLYLNLARKNLRINIFPLPKEILREHLQSGSWEFLVLYKKGQALPVAFGAARKIDEEYRWLYCGVEYAGFDIKVISPYRQLMWQLIKHAGESGCKRVHLGMGSDQEKSRFDSERVPTYAFVRSENDFQSAKLQEFVEELAVRK
jgi:7-keto-8-aminopelargonate synthetase-like enzyme